VLISRQPDNYRFHSGLQAAHLELDASTCSSMFALKALSLPSTTLPLTAAQLRSLRELYRKQNFKSKSIGKIFLTLFRYGAGDEAEGEDDKQFEEALRDHIMRCLREGIPSLHHDIAGLLYGSSRLCVKEPYEVKRHPVMRLTQRVVDEFIESLTKHESFFPPSAGR
jgi:hypothetical protein